MNKGITKMGLSKYNDYDEPKIKEYGDVSINFQGKDEDGHYLNNGCRISELRHAFSEDFGITSSELRDIQEMAKKLVKSRTLWEANSIVVDGKITKTTYGGHW